MLYNRLTRTKVEPDSRKTRLRRMRKRVGYFVRRIIPSSSMAIMITLTYGGFAWSPNHIRAFIRRIYSLYRRRILGYCWVAELQRNGKVHYHILVFFNGFLRLPYPDKEGWWPYGMTRVEIARSRFYLLKYLQKGYFEGDFPKGLRLFGIGLWKEVRDSLDADTLREFRLLSYPAWVAWAVCFSGYSSWRYYSGLGYVFDGMFLAKGFWLWVSDS